MALNSRNAAVKENNSLRNTAENLNIYFRPNIGGSNGSGANHSSNASSPATPDEAGKAALAAFGKR